MVIKIFYLVMCDYNDGYEINLSYSRRLDKYDLINDPRRDVSRGKV